MIKMNEWSSVFRKEFWEVSVVLACIAESDLHMNLCYTFFMSSSIRIPSTFRVVWGRWIKAYGMRHIV